MFPTHVCVELRPARIISSGLPWRIRELCASTMRTPKRETRLPPVRQATPENPPPLAYQHHRFFLGTRMNGARHSRPAQIEDAPERRATQKTFTSCFAPLCLNLCPRVPECISGNFRQEEFQLSSRGAQGVYRELERFRVHFLGLSGPAVH